METSKPCKPHPPGAVSEPLPPPLWSPFDLPPSASARERWSPTSQRRTPALLPRTTEPAGRGRETEQPPRRRAPSTRLCMILSLMPPRQRRLRRRLTRHLPKKSPMTRHLPKKSPKTRRICQKPSSDHIHQSLIAYGRQRGPSSAGRGCRAPPLSLIQSDRHLISLIPMVMTMGMMGPHDDGNAPTDDVAGIPRPSQDLHFPCIHLGDFETLASSCLP